MTPFASVRMRDVSMPRTETSVTDQRIRSVARLLEGEPKKCAVSSGSRKTGYKLFERYREDRPVALADRSHRPVRI